jgi:hypothetical protein
LLVTAKAVPSSPLLVTLMMDALPSSEKSLTASIPEEGSLHTEKDSQNVQAIMEDGNVGKSEHVCVTQYV